MLQCVDCELCERDPQGQVILRCDPFSTVKEAECLQKWQVFKINQMVAAYHATLGFYRRMAPMQEKMFKAIEREIDDMGESEKWKLPDEDDPWDSPEQD